ncbi:MAG: hypothetical protein QW703_01365 [Candidatus Aenigmatarchaeota archaeon]
MKLQANIIGMVILIGIFIALLTFSYQTLIPIMQLNEAIGKFQQAKAFALQIANGIVTVANEGGSKYYTIPSGMVVRVQNWTATTKQNSIWIEFSAQVALDEVEARTQFPELTNSIQDGIYGKDRPWQPMYLKLGKTMRIEIYFRNLIDSKTYAIKLEEGKTTEGHTIKISYNRTETSESRLDTYVSIEFV